MALRRKIFVPVRYRSLVAKPVAYQEGISAVRIQIADAEGEATVGNFSVLAEDYSPFVLQPF
jgi:hypothetical protein